MPELITGQEVVKNTNELFSVLVDNHKKRFNGGEANLIKYKNGCISFLSAIFTKDCWPHKIERNDPMFTILSINPIGVDQYELVLYTDGKLLIKPLPHESHLNFSSVKCAFRKVKGDAQKIIDAVEKWQAKRFELVQKHKSEIKGIETSNLSLI